MPTDDIFEKAKALDPRFQFDGEYEAIPPVTQANLLGWLLYGTSGGDFLDAVLTNDLATAFGYADDENAAALGTIVRWVYNRAPQSAWLNSNFRERAERRTTLRRAWPGLLMLTNRVLDEDDGDPS